MSCVQPHFVNHFPDNMRIVPNHADETGGMDGMLKCVRARHEFLTLPINDTETVSI